MKIGILYVCTGKYDVFWKDFYLSCEKYFIPNAEKYYFVYTDAEYIFDEENNKNINRIYQEQLKWPYATLLRFSFFEKTIDRFKNLDYLFFFNANALIMEEIDESFLPIEENLLVVEHPLQYKFNRNKFTYDRNKKSLAYIPYDEGKYYVLGGLNGGKSKDYIKLIKTLNKNIKIDLENGVIALWHDESHLNKYILNRTDVKVLGPEYMYPEDYNLPLKKKIITRDKNKYGGHDKLRGVKKGRLKRSIKKIIKKILKMR